MYTELHYNAELCRSAPQNVIDVLNYMIQGDFSSPAPELPKHVLFQTDRWAFMLRSDSYYFAAKTYSTMEFDAIGDCYYLCIRCNLKNYSKEIEKFIDWIDPYICAIEGDFLGFSRYEETEDPTVIRKK